MGFDEDRVRELVERAINRQTEAADPLFYAVGGSHVYGFADPDSDVDVRGIHVGDGRRYMLLDGPTGRVRVNQDGLTHGFEDYPEMDLVSFELRTFGKRLLDANFNVVEFLLEGAVVRDEDPAHIEELRETVREELPLDVPNSYWGLAKSTYERTLVEGRDGYDPAAKNYLYALRGLLGAEYVTREGDLVADLPTVARATLDDDGVDLIEALIDRKRADEPVEEDLRARADDLLEHLFETVETPRDVDKSAYREGIDGWMREIRRERGHWA